jgi:hypothetical protein
MDDLQIEKIDWIINPIHTFFKNLLIFFCFISISGIIILGIIYWRIYSLNWNIIGIILAIFISLPLGFFIVFLKCPIQLGFLEKKVIIDWYVKPTSYSLSRSSIKDIFPQATKVIIGPNEIQFENVVDIKIFDYEGGSWLSGGLYYMNDKSVFNTSGVGLELNNMILSALYNWLKIHNQKSPLFLKLEKAKQ